MNPEVRSGSGGLDVELDATCARHTAAAASYQCCECGQKLCHRCVEVGSHLIFCGLCGERAIELDELERLVSTASEARAEAMVPSEPLLEWVPPAGERSREARPEVGAASDFVRPETRPESADRPNPWLLSAPPPDSPGTEAAVFLINHAVIPAATIAMVAALLFFLLDVRSIFLSGTEPLKWVGFWFVTATVLIARYGRASAYNTGRQGFYTAALAGATGVAMTVSPWANPSGGLSGSVVNLFIIFLVWRFATRLTYRLSFEGSRPKAPEERLYGLERLRFEQVTGESATGPRGEVSPKAAKQSLDDGSHPGAPVARLAAAGLLAFALGEPLLLAGPPAIGERALGAMIVFLLAAGVVLAAGSGLGTLKRVRAVDGQASLGMLPGRVVLAGVVMILLSALALTLPGIEARGTGALRPTSPEQGVESGESEEGGEPREASSADEEGESSGKIEEQASSEGQSRDSKPAEAAQGLSGAASSLIGPLANLGEWLRLAILFISALIALGGLWWFLSHLARSRAWLKETFGGYLRRWLAQIRGLFQFRKSQRSTPLGDPFADWEGFQRLSPRAAVLEGYGRLLTAFAVLEHPRIERQTPHEFFASIPNRLRPLKDPAGRLTEMYVKAAYSEASVEDSDRQGVLEALETIRGWMRQQHGESKLNEQRL